MLPELTPEELSHALDTVAGEVLDRLPTGEAPIDALALARAWGLAVAWDERQTGRGRMARLAPHAGVQTIGSILLRPDPRRERLQWAIAHELGEFRAHRVFEHLSVDAREAPPAAREAVANALASRILLPREAFERAGRHGGWDLYELKARFSTASHELIARRMLDFGPKIIVTIFDHRRRTFRRGNLPFRVPPPGELELSAWRVAHEQSCYSFQEDFARCVQAWPIHEPQWKREILRTQWLADEDA